MIFGGGPTSFWIDVPDAVAQAISTRLKLLQGEFFLDVTDGTPWSTQVLGSGTTPTYDAVLRARILGTPGASAMVSYSSQRVGRKLSVQAQVETVYSTTAVPVAATL